MRFYPDVAIKIASRPTTAAGLTFTCNSNTLPFVNAGRYFDIDGSLLRHSTGAFTFLTWIGNNLSAASTLPACRDHLEETAAFCDLAGSFAHRTLAGGASFCAAVSTAFTA